MAHLSIRVKEQSLCSSSRSCCDVVIVKFGNGSGGGTKATDDFQGCFHENDQHIKDCSVHGHHSSFLLDRSIPLGLTLLPINIYDFDGISLWYTERIQC
jgi:hypothetical protein